MEVLKKNFRRIFMLTGILIFALSISVFAAEEHVVSSSGDFLAKLTSAKSGDTIKLEGTVDFGDVGTFEDSIGKHGVNITGKKIILDLNGNSIKSACNKSTLRVEADAELVIEDSVGKGKVISNYQNGVNGWGIALRNYGKVTVNAGTFESDEGKSIYAMFIGAGCTTIIKDGTFNNGLYTNGTPGNACNVTINGGNFTKASYFAGKGVYEINGGNFEIAATENIQQAIVIKRGEMTVNGGTFKVNVETTNNDSAEVGKDGSGSYKAPLIVSKGDGYIEEVIVRLKGGTFENVLGEAIVLANESNIYNINVEIDGATINGKMAKYCDGTADTTLTFKSGTVNDLQSAIDNVADNGEITLLENIESEDSIVINNGKKFTINLNGKTVSAPQSVIVVKHGDVTFTGKGVIKETLGNYGAVEVYGSTQNEANYTTVTIEEDVELMGWSPIMVRQGAGNTNYGSTVNVYGKLTGINDCSNAVGHGLFVNGSIKNSVENYPVINIYEGAIISGTGDGIYGAGYAKWNIEGGEITGVESAIGLKAGIWNISGNTKITATGENMAPTEGYNNGIKPSGAAIQIESNDGYEGLIEMNITGGVITSEKGYSVYEYVAGSNTAVKSINITDGKFKGEIVTSDELKDSKKLAVSGGYYTEAPTSYIVDGYVAVASDDPDYNYMLGKLDTTTMVQQPVIENKSNNTELNSVVVNANENDVLTATDTYSKDEEYVGTLEEAKEALTESGIVVNDDTEITIVVQPYIDIEVKSGDVSGQYLELDIKALYTVVATTNSGDMKPENTVELTSEPQELKTTEPIEITIVLPVDFANEGATLYVHHKKSDVTYVYETTVSNGAITFTNPHGFSEFVVKADGGLAKNITTETTYSTLEEAILKVNSGDVIELLSGDTEQIEITRESDFTFTLKGTQKFSGAITAGSNATITATPSGDDEIIYVYDYTVPTLTPTPPTTGGGGSSVTTYRITVTQTTGGEISPKTTSVEKGENITFTIKANEGYKIKDVIVDAKSVGIVSTYTFEKVESRHAITAIFEKADAKWTNPYKDVKENDWFYDSVKLVSEKGLFNGMKVDEFGPEITMTRGMLVTVLYRLEGEPATNRSIPFADVDMSMYYANAISWAKQNNIVNGIDENNFAPNTEITREQLVTILYRYAKAKGMDVSVGEDTNILSYDDALEVSEYAVEAFQWACGAGIINGRTESTLVPQGNAKRCEVATMILRFCEE